MTVHLVVYVAGGTAAATQATRMVRDLVEGHLGGDADVRVVDVMQDPQAAEDHRVMVTPTIDCLAPLPLRRAVGIPQSVAELASALMLDPITSQDPAP